MEYQAIRALLVGVCTNQKEADELEKSLCELERLLDTAGGVCFAKVIQNMDKPNPRTLIGSGKVAEIAALCADNEIELVVFDEELAPSQIRNLEEELGKDVRVIDRSMLILDIFALHAVSREGKLQVELAQLKYTAPRLTGHGVEMSRLGGGIGTRGPGESKLETDRRHMHRRVVALEEELRELEGNRKTMRAARDRSGIPKIAIVGYTNAGKSTLLNRLTDAGILAEDKLFATLDATTRKSELPSGETVLFTDTVGFIRKLPHHLVKAFKSTLDEVVYSDVLLIVSDINDPEVPEHIKVTEEVIEELGASDKPKIYVYNKCDMCESGAEYVPTREDTVRISAKTGYGIDELFALIEKTLSQLKKEYTLLIPYDMQAHLSSIYNNFSVISIDYTENGVLVKAVLDEKGKGMYSKYIVDNNGEV